MTHRNPHLFETKLHDKWTTSLTNVKLLLQNQIKALSTNIEAYKLRPHLMQMMDLFDRYELHFKSWQTFVTTIAKHSPSIQNLWTCRNQQLLVIKVHDKHKKYFTRIKFGLPSKRSCTQVFRPWWKVGIHFMQVMDLLDKYDPPPHKLANFINKYYKSKVQVFKACGHVKNNNY